MDRIPLAQVTGILFGSTVVLGLFFFRGFTLSEHARILLGGVTLVWLVGFAWTLAAAAERRGGWKRLEFGQVLAVLIATIAAAFAPAAVLALFGVHPH